MRTTRRAVALGAGMLALPRIASGQGATPAATPTVPGDEFAGLVELDGGRHLYLECRGNGGPTVVLEAGYRSPAAVWTGNFAGVPGPMVAVGVAALARTCLYERPGVAAVLDGAFVPSRSAPVPMPRTAADVVADLHALLHAAGEQPPFVLVGHSFGGLFVRLYAATWPEDVAGLVLVDALSEAVRDSLSPADWDAYAGTISAVPPELAAYADLETVDVNVSFDQMIEAMDAQPLEGIPLSVVSAGLPFGIPEADLGFSPDALQAAWSASQTYLAALTPDARHLVATESSHYVQIQQPDLVIGAVAGVLAAVHDPASW